MNKLLKVSLIVAVIIIFLGIALIGISLLMGATIADITHYGSDFIYNSFEHNKPVLNSDYSDTGHYQVDTTDIREIYLDWEKGKIEISACDGDRIIFSEDAVERENALQYEIKNGRLYIRAYSKIGLNMKNKDLKVQIPSEIMGTLSLTVNTVSAELEMKDIDCKVIIFDSISGNFISESVNTGSAKINTTSGDIRFSGSYLSFSADTVSGDVSVACDRESVYTSIDTNSGDIYLAGYCGELSVDSTSGEVMAPEGIIISYLEADTGSGDIELVFDTCPREMDMESVSGDITLHLPTDSGFVLDYETVSGDLGSEFNMLWHQHEYLLYGDGESAFNIETGSGDLDIICR